MELNPRFQRLALLTGLEAVEALSATRVIVFGLGGVGGWCAEALVRSGVGNIVLVDSDIVCITNINRQVQATTRTVGISKAQTLKERLMEINPACHVKAEQRVFEKKGTLEQTVLEFGLDRCDYVIDAIDSVSCKLDLIEAAALAGVTFFSSMGTALKLDPSRLKTADIWKTSGCPLARLVRQGLKKRGFTGSFTVVYSEEQIPRRDDIPVSCGTGVCLCPEANRNAGGKSAEWCSLKKVINGSSVTVTAAAGMILASLVIRHITERQ